MPKSLKIYLAAPLFTLAERRLNTELARELTKLIPRAEIILPQIRAAEFVIDGKMDFENVVRDCIHAIDSADALVAILDGADSDSGEARGWPATLPSGAHTQSSCCSGCR